MHRRLVIGILALAAALTTAAGELPRLPPGQHLSVLPFGYFEPPAPGTAETLDALLAEAVARGMTTVSYELDWSEIEVAPGVYDLASFTSRLEGWADRGLVRPYLNISAISIGGLGVPGDLVDPADPVRLRDGRRIDDPLVVNRYLAMLDSVDTGQGRLPRDRRH